MFSIVGESKSGHSVNGDSIPCISASGDPIPS